MPANGITQRKQSWAEPTDETKGVRRESVPLRDDLNPLKSEVAKMDADICHEPRIRMPRPPVKV